ncbi:P-loop containing nucleoside triphosphate hydrolase [Sesbania bispinosa]|nr:P-loop containing nucleoside triphosphate hydrolase [Sesbania bispinosa]
MNWVELLFWIALTAVLIFSVVLDCLVISYEDEVKWIKRKLELLEALTKDYDQLVKKRDEVESGVRRLWELEDLSGGIHLQLSGAENEWVKSTEEVVSKAKRCVARYKRHSHGPFLGPLTATFRAMPIISVICEIKSVKREMRDHLQKKDEKAKEISKSMENSRSLLDQYKYIIEEADKSVAAQNQKQKQPSTRFEELMKKSEHIFSTMEERRSIYLLLPLHAFVKDLSQLHLETETEKLWKKEAEEVIEDAETLINNYLWWFDWFPIFSILKKFKMPIPIVTHQFRKGMRNIVTEFDGLLKRKEKYNLAFIDRAAEKSIFPSIIDDKEITSAIKSIHSKLNNLQKSSKHEPEMNPVCHALEEMYKQFQKAEETAGRNACVEQLKSIAKEVDNLLERYMNEPELKRQEIKNATDLLQKIIRICSIKRQKSTKVVGLKNEVRDLVSKLTTSSDNPSTLSIVGMKGVGKTTLAKAVYYNKAVVEHFRIRVWVTVTEGAVYKAKVLLMDKHGTKNQTLYVTQVKEHLKEKLCLVVLDNVSKTEDFDKLDETLSGSGWTNGSRIVLTTRFKNVASHADSSSTPHHIHIRLLTMEESWALFVKVAGFEKKKLDQKVEKFARKVVGRCGGLPHEILSLGCVMSAKDITQENLSWVLRRINHGRHREHWLQAWEKNRQELIRGTLINCLYYFTHFPVDFEIPARRLINLWVAEGLVQQNNQQTPEDAAERCLEDLRDRNMIQVVALKSNAKIKTCRLPSMLREIILQDNDGTSHSQHLGTHLERRFAYHFDYHGLDANSTQVLSKKGIPISVFFFDKREGSKPGEQVGKILSTGIVSEQFLEIKVLDLERVFRPQLPESLVKLTNIKYLSLRWTYLEEFPLCICKLMELETLDLKHTCIRVIPSSIWKLKRLKNLYLSQKYRSRLEGKPSGKFEENLQTLWGVFLYGSYPLLRYLDKLKNLQKLKLAFQLTELEQDTVASKIVQLKQLNSLRLRSIDEDGERKILKLNNMSKLEKLSSLQLFGLLEDKLRMSRLPQNLIDLTLSASKLSDDPMTELQNLPELKSLCLYADSYTGIKMVCASGSFRKLQVLRFWKLWNLQEWDVKDGAMPSLVEFEARFCENLDYPTGLKHLKTLRMVKLHKMSDQFIRDIKTLLNDVEIDSKDHQGTLTSEESF